MKRYIILAASVALLLLLLFLLPRQRRDTAANNPSQALQQELAITNLNAHVAARKPPAADAEPPAVAGSKDGQQQAEVENAARVYTEHPDVLVAVYGFVVDQDSNALANVVANVEVIQWDRTAPPDDDLKVVRLQQPTAADGRFEVSGLTGHSVIIRGLSKAGYEPESDGSDYGDYGPHAGSPEGPIVFRMWSTNLHEPLVGGEKSFVVIPDGRRYAIDLVKGTIAEGEEGDLVAWIKRPDKVRWGQRYDWTCELAIPAGGLLEDTQYGMFRAPEAGYTNAFEHREEQGRNGWGPLTGDKRFYVRLRNGQIYGRIVVNLYADFHGRQPAMIRLSYAINPSGSRLLR